ncbi:hypothetical protein LSAT2_018621 [Lamellibrachia satsuma]|nr:hypothetical protein LSAT2_018621 [Lamellibrachia satsuma]
MKSRYALMAAAILVLLGVASGCGICVKCCYPESGTCDFSADLSSGDATLDATTTWLKSLAPSGSTGCIKQGVVKLEPPVWAKSMTLRMKFENPKGFSFNLGDSPTNNGYAGDAGTFPGGYAAEIHNVGNRLLVYKNDLQDGCRSKNMFDLPASMTSELTIRVSFNQMCVYNGAGVKIFKQDKCLFRFDTMYLGLNRVIHNNAGYLFSGFQTSVRDNRLNPQPNVKTVILYEEQNIALRSNRHDVTRLNTEETHVDIVLETSISFWRRRYRSEDAFRDTKQ